MHGEGETKYEKDRDAECTRFLIEASAAGGGDAIHYKYMLTPVS